MISPISPDAVRRARQADLVEYLRGQGHELRREGDQYRLPGHGGLLIAGNKWYHHSEQQGGNALDFLLRVEGLPFRRAVEALTGIAPAPRLSLPAPPDRAVHKDFSAPERAADDRRVYAYLTQTRGIPGRLVTQAIRAGLLHQDQRGNCCFVCRDEEGRARGAMLHGTTSRAWKRDAPGSDKRYGWHWPPAASASTLVVTEAPVDAMSLVALYPGARRHHLLALGGAGNHGAAMRFLERHPHVTRVVIAFDADLPGREAAARLRQAAETAGREVKAIYPEHGKDWNDELSFRRREDEMECE